MCSALSSINMNIEPQVKRFEQSPSQKCKQTKQKDGITQNLEELLGVMTNEVKKQEDESARAISDLVYTELAALTPKKKEQMKIAILTAVISSKQGK